MPAILNKIITIIVNPAIGLLFGVATLVFMWGVFEMIYHADDPTARSLGQQHVLWGAVGFAIMLSAYGIIHLVLNTVGVPTPAGLN